MNKVIFIILLLLTACTQPEKSAKKWVEEAKPLDSIHVVSPEDYADIEKLQLRGTSVRNNYTTRL